MFCLHNYHCLFRCLRRPLALLPCYEAIHHKVLDSEEIILYIEGQLYHLVGDGGGFNHLPVVALNKERGFFFLPILWQQKGRRSGVGGEGAAGSHRGIPLHCGDTPPPGPSPGTAATSYWTVTQIARLERRGSYRVHGDYISPLHFLLFFWAKFSRGHLYFMRLRCESDTMKMILFFCSLTHLSSVLPRGETAECVCVCVRHGQRTYATRQTVLAGCFLDIDGITTWQSVR